MLTMIANAPGITQAAQVLNDGGLVAFPTETVYGLGANAENDHGIARIFAVKGRPTFNPLIVHVPTRFLAEQYARFTPLATHLADRFWPGPLTLVLPRAEGCQVSRLASAGLETIALRMPIQAEAQALLAAFGRGIAAPSANRSGRLSPTRAAHVEMEYANSDEAPDLLLAGADCAVGLESTIVDVTGHEAVILRPGSITREMLLAAGCTVHFYEGDGIKAPGMLSSHYAPRLPLRLNTTEAQPGEGMLGFGACAPISAQTLNLSPAADMIEAAANLFAYLHRLDSYPLQGIAVAPIPEEGIGLAILDRLRRAAAPRV